MTLLYRVLVMMAITDNDDDDKIPYKLQSLDSEKEGLSWTHRSY